jgi:hydrogenase-4 component F
MRLAFIMALLGYGTKAGLVPMHTWKPDAYAEAPVPSAALLGAGFINCAVYGIIRFDVLAEKCLGHGFPGGLLSGFGIGSILVAVPFVLVQRNFRRILAYSSIDHAGIMVAALGFGGKLGVLGALLHMLFHAVTKPLLFFCAGNVQQHFGTPYFRRVSGVIHALPWTGALFLVASLAVTGVPPFSLFQSEFTALSAALMAAQPWSAALFTAGVVTIFAGFLVHMVRLNLGSPAQEALPARECPWKLGAMLLVLAPLVLFAVALPSPIFRLVESAVDLSEVHHDFDGGPFTNLASDPERNREPLSGSTGRNARCSGQRGLSACPKRLRRCVMRVPLSQMARQTSQRLRRRRSARARSFSHLLRLCVGRSAWVCDSEGPGFCHSAAFHLAGQRRAGR